MRMAASGQKVQTSPQKRDGAKNRQQNRSHKLPKKRHYKPLLTLTIQDSGPTNQYY